MRSPLVPLAFLAGCVPGTLEDDPGSSAEELRWVGASPANYTDGRGGEPVRYVVIHTTQGSYAGAISWFQNPAAQSSAHYVIRSADGEITQMVSEADTAWHAGHWLYNLRSVGIEHEGWVDSAAWYTDAMYRASARLTCRIARRHGIPIDRAHIIGHVEVPLQDHTDPGPHWDWPRYMALVREACEEAPAPVCPWGNGLYCGGNGVGGWSRTLYDCEDGVLTWRQTCAETCVHAPPGVDDYCE